MKRIFGVAWMTDQKPEREQIQTGIWREQPEPDNPYAAARCYCNGYDVYGDLLGKASWSEYIHLLFKGERPTPEQSKLLETLAIALANPGPRDHSVQAAMNAGVSGGASASCLIAAVGVGAGSLGGAREVFHCMVLWEKCARDFDAWRIQLSASSKETRMDVWPEMEHPPGFDPYGVSTTTPVIQTLAHISQFGESLAWLKRHREWFEEITGLPLSMVGLAAAALIDIGFNAKQGEMIYLLLRLPGAAAHALEQRASGWRKFPMFMNGGVELMNDPGPCDVVKDEPNEL